jgi:uncharacterized protein (DUF927 family)
MTFRKKSSKKLERLFLINYASLPVLGKYSNKMKRHG